MILNFKNFVLFESMESDANKRQYISDCYDIILDLLKKNGSLVYDKGEDAYLVDFELLPSIQRELIPSFVLVFNNCDSTKTTAYLGLHYNVTFCIDNYNGNIEKRCYELFKKNKYVFTHEMTHLLDLNKSHRLMTQSGKHLDVGDIDGYYNNSAEVNAYYNELLAVIDDALATTVPLEIKKRALSDNFNEFVETVIDTADFPTQTWWQHLSRDNKKRVLRRLYQYFEVRIKKELHKK